MSGAAPTRTSRRGQLPGDQIVETAGIALTYLTKGSPGITPDVLDGRRRSASNDRLQLQPDHAFGRELV